MIATGKPVAAATCETGTGVGMAGFVRTAHRAMRHNPRMDRPVAIALLFVAALLPACDGALQTDALPPRLAQADGQLAWQGLRRCADCDGIESTLTLRWSGDAREYALVETYLAAEGGMRFEDNGDWRHRGNLILLDGEGGERRAYLLLDDGRLQPRGLDGDAFEEGSDDLMVPMEAGDGF